MSQLIALVNQNDEVIGYDHKLVVHQKGLLHRAFSIFVFNSKREILLQRRALEKYHSAGLWTNTCCSHLPKGFQMESFIHQRLKEEMGFDCNLKYVETFKYYVDFQNGMIENEVDHIYFGLFEGEPSPDPAEVFEWRWVGINELKLDIRSNPGLYTYWFQFIVENHFDFIQKLP